jgi:hypothetical protein
VLPFTIHLLGRKSHAASERNMSVFLLSINSDLCGPQRLCCMGCQSPNPVVASSHTESQSQQPMLLICSRTCIRSSNNSTTLLIFGDTGQWLRVSLSPSSHCHCCIYNISLILARKETAVGWSKDYVLIGIGKTH